MKSYRDIVCDVCLCEEHQVIVCDVVKNVQIVYVKFAHGELLFVMVCAGVK